MINVVKHPTFIVQNGWCPNVSQPSLLIKTILKMRTGFSTFFRVDFINKMLVQRLRYCFLNLLKLSQLSLSL